MPKPLNLLVLTDGEADDPDTLAYVSFPDGLLGQPYLNIQSTDHSTFLMDVGVYRHSKVSLKD